MTHITQATANELAAKHDLWSFRESPASLLVICNAAIQTYLDSLSADLPEPVAVLDKCQIDRANQCCRAIHCTRKTDVFTRDQLLSALAARDAKWQGEIDEIKQVQFVNKVKSVANGWKTKVDRLEAQRDAAIAEAQKQAGLAAAWKLTHDVLVAASLPVQVDTAIDAAMKESP